MSSSTYGTLIIRLRTADDDLFKVEYNSTVILHILMLRIELNDKKCLFIQVGLKHKIKKRKFRLCLLY